MNSPKSWYSGILESLQKSPDLAKVGRIATTLTSYRDPNLGLWFRDAIQSRYRELTRPGLPDGPRYQRPYISR